jgi:hypothetical protein
MPFQRCPICKEYGFTDGPLMHRCKPVYHARDLEGDYLDDWSAVYADSAEQAAEKLLAQLAEGECNVTIVVRDPGGNLSRWSVDAEYVLNYSAREESLSEDDRARLAGEGEDPEDDEPHRTNDAEDRYNRGGW